MTVKEIIKNYLRDGGFGGLANCEVGCGCELDDLFLCDAVDDDCEPAYKKPNPNSLRGWSMTTKKPKEAKT